MPVTIVLRRFGYRVAFRLLQVYWLLRRPTKAGVKCVITDGDRVLLVRHTYGSRAWDLPGGAVKRGEDPGLAARREMEEELGLGDAGWHALGEIRGGVNRRRDVVAVYGAEVADPRLTLDLGELEVAAFFARDRLPLWLGPYVTPILEAVAGTDPGAPAPPLSA